MRAWCRNKGRAGFIGTSIERLMMIAGAGFKPNSRTPSRRAEYLFAIRWSAGHGAQTTPGRARMMDGR